MAWGFGCALHCCWLFVVLILYSFLSNRSVNWLVPSTNLARRVGNCGFEVLGPAENCWDFVSPQSFSDFFKSLSMTRTHGLYLWIFWPEVQDRHFHWQRWKQLAAVQIFLGGMFLCCETAIANCRVLIREVHGFLYMQRHATYDPRVT